MATLEFVIIGLTGPLGAGCSTLADFIVRTKPKAWVRSMQLVKEAHEGIKTNSELLRVNGQNEQALAGLKQSLEEREYLQIITQSTDPLFVKISMSSLIVLRAVESVSSTYFQEWAKDNAELGVVLSKLHVSYAESIEQFRLGGYADLTSEQLSSLDEMFEAINDSLKLIKSIELQKVSLESHILSLQQFGDNLRKTGNVFNSEARESDSYLDILARDANNLIEYHRKRLDGLQTECFVIDAFRNPVEVDFFRKRYEQFYLLSIYADEETRKRRWGKMLQTATGDLPHSFDAVSKKDWGDEEPQVYQQNVSSCYYLADIALNNPDTERIRERILFKKFMRSYALILSPGCVQPTREETNMDLAYSLSLRSSCISRKVGAVITDKGGYVVGMGWNEAAHGQIGCGYRHKGDVEQEVFSMETLEGVVEIADLVTMAEHHSFCLKDTLSRKLIQQKLKKLDLAEETVTEIGKRFNIKRLEYCRSLHAEENALLQLSARGGMGVEGGDIYTTTFPCELCAKKIYQTGITRIFYTEPYPHSLSERIFLRDGGRQIELKQFEGVKSPSYYRLFKPRLDKKDAQKLEQ